VITGGNSAVGLRSYPSRYALADEIDGYELDIEGEGSPIDLLIQRTAAFRNRKIFMVSTPTLAGFSAIEKWYNAGDQNQYLMPCPLCGHMQPLIWGADRASTGALGGLRWPKGSPDLARYQCEQCGDLFEEWRKVEALNRAGWEPMAAGNGRGKIRSYGINALYYPYGWPGNTWTQLAAEWERVHRDPIGLKTFVNTKLGQPWKDPTEAKLDADILLARRESFGESLPAGVAVLTFGADVQINRIEAELIGWGANEESWSIEYLVFVGDTTKLVSGDPNHPSPWEQLDAWARGEWLSELGIPLSIRAGCIDAGYQGQIVRKFCGERFGRRLWATIGRAGQGHPVWPTRAARKMEKRQQYPPAIVIGVDQAKEIVYARLKIDHPGPGFCHFPVTRDRDYFEMLTAEVCVPDYTGTQPRRVWKKKASGARNESLDARNNGYAAMLGLVSTTGLNLSKEAERIRQMVEAMRNPPPEAPRRESAPSWFGENTKNWFKNR
jgi:phage terminase large subunit GpA-like protein